MVQQIQQNIQKKRKKKIPRSMRLKIQKSMMVILAVTLVLFYVILSVILYNQNLSILRAEVTAGGEVHLHGGRYFRDGIPGADGQYR